ncbi:peptidase [Actinophytocola xinjiangensis]|uniref:Extracellular small neutral protease n=1 Tax=Actinophytocola xinjiangensis TaxID=485602 RepID=A0A7Z0WEZ7_9PSEU|nr:snapalysin family zinc-dependent metalloprotease [Actinophytocola xinjiangensis]OLF05345.1 peptidase [Actinophytocola xinjiangensis]
MIRKTFLSAAVGAAMIMAPMATGQAAATTAPENPTTAATTVYYDDSGAPSYQSQIAQGVANWNNSVSNVQLVENASAATLDFYEGNDPNGSYAYTDGHGNGYIFLDHTQMGVYAPVRITAHETGHVLGLPDNYNGPCSELMSGGGPGPSCTNANPNADEIGRVNSLWANGRQGPGVFTRIAEPAVTAAF